MNKIIVSIYDYFIKHSTLMKIVLGTLFSSVMMINILTENNTSNEKMNTVQLITTLLGVFYVSFGIPWGFCRLKMIRWEQFSRVPFIGSKIYIIIKIGISCIIGTSIIVYDLLKWIIYNKKNAAGSTWLETEREKEKKS